MTSLETILEGIYSYPLCDLSVNEEWFNEVSAMEYDDQYKAVNERSLKITNEVPQYAGMIERFDELNVELHGTNRSFENFQIPSFVDTQAKSARFKSRFLLVEVGNAFAYVPIRIQDSMGLRMSGKKPFFMAFGIVPTDCSQDTETAVENLLKKVGCIETMRRTQEDYPDEKPFHCNFYATADDFANMRRSSWRSAHGINKLRERVDVKVLKRNEMTDEQVADVRRMCADWHSFRMGTKDPYKAKLEDYYLLDYSWQGQLRYILFYLDGALIGHSIVDVFGNIVNVNVLRPSSSIGQEYIESLGIDSDTAKYLCSNLCNFMIYTIDELAFDQFDVSAVYIGGTLQGSVVKKKGQDLFGYKARLFKHKIEYVKVPLV